MWWGGDSEWEGVCYSYRAPGIGIICGPSAYRNTKILTTQRNWRKIVPNLIFLSWLCRCTMCIHIYKSLDKNMWKNVEILLYYTQIWQCAFDFVVCTVNIVKPLRYLKSDRFQENNFARFTIPRWRWLCLHIENSNLLKLFMQWNIDENSSCF
jgi:hypothetical protein